MEIRFPKPIASDADISRFESLIAGRLPDDYKRFLRTYNGGKPDPDCFPFLWDGREELGIVDWFLSLGGDVDCDIEENYSLYYGRIPTDCIPIAFDPGGNLVVLSITGTRRNDLFIWMHEYEAEVGDPASEDNIYRICAGFDKFLESLIEYQPPNA